MSERCPLYIELCAGSAAVALRLLGISRPPIAFMGAKTQMASTILRAMGLRPGQGADAVVLADAGPWGHAWSALLDPAIAHQVAQVLRGWAGENPRALWDRLARTAPADPELWAPQEVATWLWVQGRSCSATPVWLDGGGWAMAEKRTNRGKTVVQRGEHPDHRGLGNPSTVANRIEAIRWQMCRGGSSTRSVPAVQRNEAGLCDPRTVAERIESIASWLVLQAHAPSGIPVVPDGHEWRMGRLPTVTDGAIATQKLQRSDAPPRISDVARRVDWLATWLTLQAHSPNSVPVLSERGEWKMGGDPYPTSPPTKKLQRGSKPPQLVDVARRVESVAAWLFRCGNSWRGAGEHWRSSERQTEPGRCQITQATLAERVEALAGAGAGPFTMAAVLRCDVAQLHPPADLPPGTRVYIDPPYHGCTGYGFDLPRPQVLDLGREWSDAGAMVAISEAEPLPIPGWHHVEITPVRRWASRKGKRKDLRREFLTMNRPPACMIEQRPEQLQLMAQGAA